MKEKGPPRVFYGWWMNVVTAVLTGLAQVFTVHGASALFGPVSAEFDLTRAQTSITSGVATLSNGVVFFFAGWLSDRFGSKRVILAGACITGACMTLLSFVETPLAYFVVWGLTAAGVSLGFTIAVDTLLTNWFDRKRGMAFSVRFAIMGLVPALTLPLVSWLISTRGWRVTSLLWGGLVFAGVPFLYLFVRQGRPELYGLHQDGVDAEKGSNVDGAANGDGDFTIRQIVRTPTYWALTVAWVLSRVASQGVTIHIIPLLTDMGVGPVAAGGMLALMSLFMIPSRVLGGVIADRVGGQRLRLVIAGALLLWASGLTVFLLAPTMAGVYVFLALWGLGSGSFIPLDIVLRSRFFGRRAFGQQQGISSLISAPLSFFAPIYTGWMYDVSGSYATPFTVFTALIVVSAASVCLARAPASPSDSGASVNAVP
ncbi:MFS transporter [Candidatus Bathyarchaeota archaeon]|nr:MFS transporter [Candidatus Bathyarchaeota archaeon]